MKSIYHYTSIETLALILKNNTWRFSRLDILDDIQEGENLPYKLAKQIFVACFSYEEFENIPQWEIYGGRKGIRLSFGNQLPIEILKVENKKGDSYHSILKPSLDTFNRLKVNYDDFRFFPHHNEKGEVIRDISFITVEYDTYENVSLNKKKCFKNDSDKSQINAKHIFALKSDYWSFQKEVRLFVHILPKVDTLLKSIDFGCDLDHLDFTIDNEIFKKSISITLGPDCSDAERIIVESLLKANDINPNGKVKDSFLKGKVRYK